MKLVSQTHFIPLNDNPKLKHAVVDAIVKDADGFMWFGTQDGLFRYDGFNYKIFKPSDSQDSISHNSTYTLYVDSKERLWIGTVGGGLNLYLPESETFKTYRYDPNKNSISHDIVTSITEDKNGVLWIGTKGGGLNKFNPEDDFFEHFNEKSKTISLSNPDINALFYLKSSNSLLVATEKGLDQVFVNSGEVKSHKRVQNNNETKTQFNAFNGIAQLDEQRVVVVGPLGAFILNLQSSEFSDLSELHPVLANFGWDAVLDKSGKLWVSTFSAGVISCDLSVKKCAQHVFSQKNERSIAGDKVRDIYLDDEGLLWFGTMGAGISRYNPKSEKFGHLSVEGVTGEHPDVWAIEELSNNRLLLGTFGHGLLSTLLPDNLIFSQSNLTDLAVGHNQIWWLKQTTNGDIWASSFGGGLFKIPKDNSEIFNFKHDTNSSNSLSFNYPWAIYEDADNMLWVGTYGRGLNKLNIETELFDRYVPSENVQGSISYHQISAIFRDNKERLWVGTYGGGLNLFNEESRSFTVFKNIEGKNDSLPHNAVIAIVEDEQNNIWVGTEGGGIAKLIDDINGQFIIFNEENGFKNNNIAAMVFDNSNQLWVSHNDGLSRYNLFTNTLSNFSAAEGLQSNVFNTNSAKKLADGRLVFGGGQGINIFDPKDIKVLLPPSSPVIQDVILVQGTNEEKRIELQTSNHFSYDVNYIKFNFSPKHFATSSKPKFRYRIAELSIRWINQVSNALILSGLKPGSYTLEIQAGFNDKHWSDSSKYSFVIEPPYYQTKAAYAVYVAIIILFIILIIRIRTQQLKRNQCILEEKVLTRTEQLGNAIKQRDSLFEHMSHEFRTPLSLIVGPTEKLLTEDLSASQRAAVTSVAANANRLHHLVEQLLSVAEVKSGITMNQTLVNEELIAGLMTRFNTAVEEKHINLKVQYDEKTPVAIRLSHDDIDTVISNLISNAIKYSPKGSNITISLVCRDKQLEIKVADEGIGIECIVKVFDRYYREAEGTPGTGLGLTIVRDIVESREGSIVVENNMNAGVTFTVLLPIISALPEEQTVIDQDYSHPQIQLAKMDKTILIVEDDIELQKFLEESLSEYVNVKVCDDGIKAMAFLENNKLPDLILSDVQMPNMDGLTLCKQVKNNDMLNHIPFLFLSAQTAVRSQLAGYQVQADDYIAKPFVHSVLIRKVMNSLKTLDAYRTFVKTSLNGIQSNKDCLKSTERIFIDKLNSAFSSVYNDTSIKSGDIASAMHVSEKTLLRKIESLTGETTSILLRNYRLMKALEKLKTGMSSKDAAFRSGFASPAYFGKCFRDKYGVTPSNAEEVSL